jgi:two-component system, NtrC family, sensor histidine kinase HydH
VYRRLSWIVALRLTSFVVLFVVVATFSLQRLDSTSESSRVLLGTLAAAFGLTLGYGVLLRQKRSAVLLGYLQIATDPLLVAGLVYVSGGPTSGAVSMFGLTCVLGALMMGRRGAALAAALAIGVYGLLTLALNRLWITPPDDVPGRVYIVSGQSVTFSVLVNLLGIAVVSLLAGYLAHRLQTTGGRLQVAEERAVEAERLATLGRVAAGLAHEIRNPLGSIKGAIEMLREAPGLAQEDRDLCGIIQRESTRLEDLVTDMMNLAKPRSPDPHRHSLALLAREVTQLASRSERSAAGDVRVVYEGPDEGADCVFDEALIRQVVWNLVRNAVQVSAPGELVQVQVESRPRSHVLSVRDAGPGVSDEERKTIFDAFYTTRTQGAGLGLAVVRRIIDDHKHLGVSIEVNNVEPKGARFQIVFLR